MASPAADADAAAATAAASTATPLSLCTPAEAAAASLHMSAWRHEHWLHTWPLNPHTVLDYFKHSDFYDKTCNNEIAIMQTMQADSIKSVRTQQHTLHSPPPPPPLPLPFLVLIKII